MGRRAVTLRDKRLSRRESSIDTHIAPASDVTAEGSLLRYVAAALQLMGKIFFKFPVTFPSRLSSTK